jgi:hypothetical protein
MLDEYPHEARTESANAGIGATNRAALREKQEQTVKQKKPDVPYDHLTETREAMAGAKKHIEHLLKHLSDPDLIPQQRIIIQSELSELSKLLDRARKILGA